MLSIHSVSTGPSNSTHFWSGDSSLHRGQCGCTGCGKKCQRPAQLPVKTSQWPAGVFSKKFGAMPAESLVVVCKKPKTCTGRPRMLACWLRAFWVTGCDPQLHPPACAAHDACQNTIAPLVSGSVKASVQLIHCERKRIDCVDLDLGWGQGGDDVGLRGFGRVKAERRKRRRSKGECAQGRPPGCSCAPNSSRLPAKPF